MCCACRVQPARDKGVYDCSYEKEEIGKLYMTGLRDFALVDVWAQTSESKLAEDVSVERVVSLNPVALCDGESSG